MGKTRAAVVLFVDIDEEYCDSPQDLALLTQWGLAQAGYSLNKAPLLVTRGENIVQVRIVDVMEAGMAAGNGYLWTEVTSKAFRQRGIYTDKEQQQLADEILEGSYEEQQETENGDS